MNIKNHKLTGVEYQQARWIGPEITPEIVILHDTASSIKKGAAAGYLRDNPAKVSVHFVIEIDGTIIQQVPVNRRANHAGASSFHGRSGCNDFSIGIELVNPGKMSAVAPGVGRTWFGAAIHKDPVQGIEIREAATEQHGTGVWMDYPIKQITALCQLLAVLFSDIPTLRDITTHWYVSPGRKIDTNPLLPLEEVRAHILGCDDPADVVAEDQSTETVSSDLVQIDAPGDGLNLRRWPSFNPNVLTTIPHEAVVPVLREGWFSGRHWLRVIYAGQEGWIVASHTAAITHSA
ncbi:MAG: N-acetylmuramoyl-L-alanine amidase [Paracoccus sp. (in: a-proteobacteria)]|uniref:N-acetylmuramoyl-L-alanine amidase n=1 Tax=Paracoccus sp. TaxID=267 RepID=UPI0026DF5076|nr:N-acetylmuramoyl-L-alanine amidase [Paracoccus sp. (in: a-proteobacteria)]MDO5631116.1 N-acetylmuramoyl-L-alanine amidase [Paracoccus sp. (in: a-proteobacteria)]